MKYWIIEDISGRILNKQGSWSNFSSAFKFESQEQAIDYIEYNQILEECGALEIVVIEE